MMVQIIESLLIHSNGSDWEKVSPKDDDSNNRDGNSNNGSNSGVDNNSSGSNRNNGSANGNSTNGNRNVIMAQVVEMETVIMAQIVA